MRKLTPLILLSVIALGAAPGQAAASARAGKDTVTLKGTAYAFDDQEPISGATIRAKGADGAKATSKADGSYKLKVPDGENVTPYIEAAGFHGIYLQTFTTDGHDLKRVNFQTPSEGIYMGLASLLDVQLDENGDPARCAIVSTASTVKIRELSFADFVDFGAHGVAGVTASAKPALPEPVYFNEDVIPDRSLSETTVDGGIVWTEVPSGNYTISAEHPKKRFASFRATCRDGRIVNANPPWGLYQLKKGESAG